MKKAIINPHKCQSCELCIVIEECFRRAPFRESQKEKPWIDFYKCSGCMKCKKLCPHGAVDDVIQPCNGKGKSGW
ncbi:MAG: 4Fe-4S binding protein [Fibrobacteres bacterium]|nr:4Fe-4S binding protein [Fibrobacterota bacterium]